MRVWLASERLWRHRPATVIGAAAAVAVFLPLLAPGAVLFLDHGGNYPGGRHPRLPPSFWGFEPELTSTAPVDFTVFSLARAFPFDQLRLLPFVAVPLLVGMGFDRLFAGRRLAACSATVLYVFNPFVYERVLAGQSYLVVAYSLLPWLLSLWVRDERRRRVPVVVTSLLLALIVALQPHFLFIVALLTIAIAGTALALRDRRGASGVLLSWVLAVPLFAYWIIPAISARGLDLVTRRDLAVFATRPDEQLGLVANVMGLYGFWHREWPLTKEVLVGWPLFLAALLVIVVVGFFVITRSGSMLPVLVGALIAGGGGLFLSLGADGPTGTAYMWLFDHLPGFRVMREAHKFAALIALAYAVAYGVGAEWITSRLGTRALRGAIACMVFALPVAYTYQMIWGFNGYVAPSRYPSSWIEADEVMGDGAGKVLVLPWHQYLAFPWTQGRVVANPASSFFQRATITSDEVGLPLRSVATNPRSIYLKRAFERGPSIDDFGRVLTPLGVRYVLLAKVADWESYAWLFEQHDLVQAREWDDLVLFENRRRSPLVYAPDARVQTIERSSVEYELELPEDVDRVILTEPFHPAWMLGTTPSRPYRDAVNLFIANDETRHVTLLFERWILVRNSYIFSAIVALSMLGGWLWSRSRRSTTIRAAGRGGDTT